MKILAIETSCDETAAAVTEGTKILSSVKHSQEVHVHWGGVVPSLAKRAHEERIDEIIDKAIAQAFPNGVEPLLARTRSKFNPGPIDAIAVTVGPGLAIALEVGIRKAKELAKKWNKPLIAVNHIEGHILSCLASLNTSPLTPLLTSGEGKVLALVISGGHTQVIRVEKIGKYKILAQSLDDDIGEALDKGARMLGLGYPGGPILEKMAAKGDPKKYKLPLPMAGKEGKAFSYSGLKTAFYRLVEKIELNEQNVCDLAASYQNMVFKHLIRTLKIILERVNTTPPLDKLGASPPTLGGDYIVGDLLVGGGVAANQTLRKQLEEMGKELGMRVWYPENLMLCTDNAAMVGVAAGFKAERGEFSDPEKVDRLPRWKVDENLL